MKSPYPNAYTSNHVAADDGRLHFECSEDTTIWPWLELHPLHPILVQTINFWASIESGMARGTFDPSRWSALTRVDWSCENSDVGLPVRGTYREVQDDEHANYALEFFDRDDRLVVKLKGAGVVFRSRNFEDWRETSKKKSEATGPSETFPFASPEEVGVDHPDQCFLTKPLRGPPVRSMGHISKELGLLPGHPYIGGSGDHVNSTHMGEIGRQFGQLIKQRPLINTGGSMRFEHYVELGRHFLVDEVRGAAPSSSFHAIVRQNGRICTRIEMRYRFAD